MTATATRVALVEDHTLLAEAVRLALLAEGFAASTVLLPHRDGDQTLLQAITLARPDVVLLDLDLGPHGDATPVIGQLTRAGSAVIVVTATTNPTRWGQCLAYGARTVLPKSASLEKIIAAVHQAVLRQPGIPETQRQQLIQQWHRQHSNHRNPQARLNRLTHREGQVLAALAHGHRVRDIATDSCVAKATVRSQVKSILAKLGVTSQLAAVALAHDVDWGTAR